MTVLPFFTGDEIAAALPRVVEQLAADRLIAYPTETVYGFGGAVTPGATQRLRTLKRRESPKPFLVLVTGPDQAPGVQWSESARLVAQRFWPGPLTIALPAADDAPAGVRSEDGTVAVRASPHPAVRALIEAWGGPITSTSANAPGQSAARDAASAERAFIILGAGADALVLDGGTLPPSRPSTIVRCEDGHVRIVRAGAISVEELKDRLRGTGIDVG